MSNFRPDRPSPKPANGKMRKLTKRAPLNHDKEIFHQLENVRDLRIEGSKKRLIKIDERHEEILKVLYPVFSVDVTRFINFLLTRFFQDHPELIEEIRESFKKL